MKRPANARARKGFTLIELLVVVSIIALLISILLPSLKAAREQARVTKCLSNLKSMGLGIQLYSNEHRVLPGPLHPPIFRKTVRPPGTPDSEWPWSDFSLERDAPWFLLYRLAPYFSESDTYVEYADKVATCPTAVKVKDDKAFIPEELGGPAGNPGWSRPYNYLINSWGNTLPEFYFGWTNIGNTWTGWERGVAQGLPGYHRPSTIGRIKRPAGEWAVGDAWWDEDIVLPRPGADPIRTMLGTWQDPGGESKVPLPRSPYHGSNKNATNLLFFDGHGATFNGVENWVVNFPANKDPENFPED